MTKFLAAVLASAMLFSANAFAHDESDDSQDEPVTVMIKKAYTGPEVEIAPVDYGNRLKYSPKLFEEYQLFEDDSTYLGTFEGKTVTFFRNPDCLEYVIMVGDEPAIHSLRLQFESVDSLHNKATFSCATDTLTVDFGKSDALQRLADFIKPPKGWTEKSLTFSFKEMDIPRDVRATAASSDDPVLNRKLFALLDKTINSDVFYGDTLYYTGKKAHDLESLMRNTVESYGLNLSQPIVPRKPNQKSVPWCYNRTYELFPVFQSGNLVTICMPMWDTYIAGGGFCRSLDFYTYDLAKDREIKFDDIFNPKFRKQIQQLYLDGVLRVLNEYELYADYEEGPGEEDFTPVPFTRETALEKMTNPDLINRVSLTKKGVVFNFDLADFTEFGEDPTIPFEIPYASLKKYMRPGFAQ